MTDMQLPTKDPAHWLYRFTAEEWLNAARNELHSAGAHEQRKAVASALRAAGMALNAVLVIAPNDAWGRSYMDHLRALANQASAPEALRQAAHELLETPLDGARLIRIGGGADEGPAVAARLILEWAMGEVSAAVGG